MNSVSDLVAAMADTPAGPADHHQEGSVLQHTIKVITELEKIRGNDPEALVAAFFHDIGKIKTPDEQLPHHYDHDKRGAELIGSLDAWFADVKLQATTQIVARQHMRFKKLPDMTAVKVIRLVKKLDETYLSAEAMVDIIEADRLGRDPTLTTNREQFETRIDAVRTATGKVAEIDTANDQHQLQKTIEFYKDIMNT